MRNDEANCIFRVKPMLIICLFFLAMPVPAYAFISVTTVALITTAIGSHLWVALVAIAVNITLFYKKIIKKKRYLILGILIIIALAAGFGYARFMKLYHLNKAIIQYRKYFSQYEVNLNDMTEDQFNQHKILYIHASVFNAISIKNGQFVPKKLSYPKLVETFNNSPENFATAYGISKSDKILIICEEGQGSIPLTMFLRYGGFDAYYGLIKGLKRNDHFIQTPFKNEKRDISIMVVPYREGLPYLFIDFIIEPPPDIHDLQLVSYKHFTPDMLEHRKLLCASQLQCTLTKYLLDYLGVKKAEIYMMGGEDKPDFKAIFEAGVPVKKEFFNSGKP